MSVRYDGPAMRTAVISDVHANLTALEAVIADLRNVSPDRVIHGGDLVGSGARPAAVIDRVRELRWPGVYGNTDEMMWNDGRVTDYFESAPARQPYREFVRRTIVATLEAIGPERLDWLRTLPVQWSDDDLAVIHASPGDAWHAPPAAAGDEELARTYGSLAHQVVYGHIHQPYVRPLPSFTLANSGSVSLSYDGDPRAAYALIDDGLVTIRRVEYDIEREIRALNEARCPDAQWLADTLRNARPQPVPRQQR
jgi:predicted phosphodiesterase